jgi:hypothetical protein
MEEKIKYEDIQSLVDYVGRTLCGRILKRIEIMGDSPQLKEVIKETIYEEMRHCRDLIYGLNYGIKMSEFKFREKGEEKNGK